MSNRKVMAMVLDALEKFVCGESGGLPATELIFQLREELAKPEWLPIESAPKDEVILLSLPVAGRLLADDRRVYEGRWHSSQDKWTSLNGFILLDGATHWQPMPLPESQPHKPAPIPHS